MPWRSPLRKFRLWGIIAPPPEEIGQHTKAIVAMFLAAFGYDELAKQAREFTGIADVVWESIHMGWWRLNGQRA